MHYGGYLTLSPAAQLLQLQEKDQVAAREAEAQAADQRWRREMREVDQDIRPIAKHGSAFE